MKKFPILTVLLMIPALILMGMVGLTKTVVEKNDKDKDKNKVVAVTEITTDTKAVLKGFVKIKGKAPEIKQEEAMKKHADAQACLKGGGTHTQEQTWIVNKDGRVANVVVWLGAPAGKKYKIDDKLKDPFKKIVEVDQPFCAFSPHVVAVLAEVQPIQFLNNAEFAHNVKLDVPVLVGSSLSANLPPGAKSDTRTFKTPRELMLTARSDRHTWMTARVLVFPHPYFAVTKADGSFTIENVPIDTDLTVYYWHESMGALDSKTELKKASFKAGDNSIEIELPVK